ncbi:MULTISPECIES: hypothetical protein [Moorena]|uniref:Uncharacterized protein n=2 Tax=Moorena producens TaxID=1155739 RepID=A0A1D9FTN8_MOOP1|nr:MULTISPECIES: hypothetical protein [Moorena]NEQ16109.1 hypothetical protein [Moorena sp. SIO3E2]AOY78758.1 hypothetical protein BJP36_01480 [Moorena producens JHB]EGJ31746.1 hypothetical protein LYNGBM3L_32690 [Moorena producens 3L]NEP31370.1 hypothetical protein [Moorena sp. SIO3B2]NEP66522.1 hypothetical protein [Moorena sp. SIO3A5]
MLNKLSILSVATIVSMTLNQGLANAISANGGSTGWHSVSSGSETSCNKKGIEKMNILVNGGEIEKTEFHPWRYKRGNNVIFNLVCAPKGDYVRVDVICVNPCDRNTYRIRTVIDELMNW